MSSEDAAVKSLLTLSLAVNVIINGILCVLGYVGNVLTIVALSKDKVYNSNILLMQVLAGYDILLLTHTLLYTVLRSVYPATGLLEAYHEKSPYIIAFVLPFGWIAQTGTIWFTTALAADRYIGITRPFKALTLCTLQNARKVVIGLSVGAFLFNFPRFFYYFNVALNSDNNSTFIAHVRLELPGFDANIYRYVYHITLTFIFLYIIPLTSLTVLNYKLIKTLRNASVTRKRMSMNRSGSPTKQNLTITLNLVIVITKFILCETPDFISSIVGAIPAAANKNEYKMFNTIKEMLLVFNSAVNFYIYCIFNVKFRENLRRAFPCFKNADLGVDQHASASSSTLNVSLSSLTLAISAFKGKRPRTASASSPQTPDSLGPARPSYGRNRNYSESRGELLTENGVSFDPRRHRLDSVESNVTVLTADSSDVRSSTGVDQLEIENEPNRTSIKKRVNESTPPKNSTSFECKIGDSKFRLIESYCDKLVAWKQFYEVSDNPEYVIFRSKENGMRKRKTDIPAEEFCTEVNTNDAVKHDISHDTPHDISHDLSQSLEGCFMYDAEDIATGLGEVEEFDGGVEQSSSQENESLEHTYPDVNAGMCIGQPPYPEGESSLETTPRGGDDYDNSPGLKVKARVKYPTFPNLLYTDTDSDQPDVGVTEDPTDKPHDVEDISIEINASAPSCAATGARGPTNAPQNKNDHTLSPRQLAETSTETHV